MPEEELTPKVIGKLRSEKDCARLIDMTVTMLGQAILISYYRRKSAGDLKKEGTLRLNFTIAFHSSMESFI